MEIQERFSCFCSCSLLQQEHTGAVPRFRPHLHKRLAIFCPHFWTPHKKNGLHIFHGDAFYDCHVLFVAVAENKVHIVTVLIKYRFNYAVCNGQPYLYPCFGLFHCDWHWAYGWFAWDTERAWDAKWIGNAYYTGNRCWLNKKCLPGVLIKKYLQF